MKRMMKRIIKAPVKKENSEKKNNTSEKKISAEQTDTEQKSDKTEQLPDVKTEKQIKPNKSTSRKQMNVKHRNVSGKLCRRKTAKQREKPMNHM